MDWLNGGVWCVCVCGCYLVGLPCDRLNAVVGLEPLVGLSIVFLVLSHDIRANIRVGFLN